MDTPTPAAKPTAISYNDILGTIGQQLKGRQSLIAKRTAFISLPLIVTVVPLAYINKIAEDFNLSGDQTTVVVVALIGIIMFITFPWAVIMGQIFKMERIIWIDSFFDKTALNSKESWQAAKRLFWPSILVNLLVFFRYYVPAMIMCIAIIVGLGQLNAQGIVAISGLAFIGIFLGLIVVFMIYAYLIKLHTRYLLFILVDTYNSAPFSYGSIFKRMRQLNRTTKSSEFVKMITTLLGTASVAGATNAVIGAMSGAVGARVGGSGQAVATAAGVYASEVVQINKSYAQTVMFYMFYRVACDMDREGSAAPSSATLK